MAPCSAGPFRYRPIVSDISCEPRLNQALDAMLQAHPAKVEKVATLRRSRATLSSGSSGPTSPVPEVRFFSPWFALSRTRHSLHFTPLPPYLPPRHKVEAPVAQVDDERYACWRILRAMVVGADAGQNCGVRQQVLHEAPTHRQGDFGDGEELRHVPRFHSHRTHPDLSLPDELMIDHGPTVGSSS